MAWACMVVLALALSGCLALGPDEPLPTSPPPYVAPLADGWEWLELAPLPRPLSDHACAVHAGSIFVMGGLTANGLATREVRQYEPDQDAWLSLLPLPNRVRGATAVPVPEGMVLAGGFGSSGTTDVRNDVLEWTERSGVGFFRAAIHPLPMPIAHAGTTVVGQQVVLAGGTHDGRAASDIVYSWGGAAVGFEQVARLTTARSQGAFAATPDDLLLAAGGAASATGTPLGGAQVQALNGSKEFDLTDVPTPRSGASTAQFAGQLFLLGGSNADGQVVAAAEFIQVTSGDWFRVVEMPEPRHQGCAVATTAGIHFLGGTDGDGQARAEHWLLRPAQ